MSKIPEKVDKGLCLKTKYGIKTMYDVEELTFELNNVINLFLNRKCHGNPELQAAVWDRLATHIEESVPKAFPGCWPVNYY